MGIRKGIAHIGTQKSLDFLRANGDCLLASVTEKTDGSFIRLSFDGYNYFIETANSGPIDIHNASFATWAKRKFGDDCNPSIMAPFDTFREALHTSFNLLGTLKEVGTISGELISALARPVDYYRVCPVGTAYSREHLGTAGLIVVHRHDNPWISKIPYDLRSMNTDHVRVDDDWSPPIEINLVGVDTPEQLYERVGEQLNWRGGKWGPEVEGYVIHTAGERFKWIHPEWKTRKEQRWQKST